MSTDELNSIVRELKELRTLHEKVSEEITALEDRIKAHMEQEEVTIITTAEYQIRWVEITSSRLDTAALKHDYPNLTQNYTNTTVTRRFTLKYATPDSAS